ncbi:MAG: hypothetical protein FJ217_14080 [Ignavibacteria bacterium]|nr:hypothetical protein [Ignavibacteria bacterium]
MSLLLPELAFDQFPVHRFNLRVALRTGFRDVAPRNRRSRISMRENAMRSVARCTIRGDNEPFTQQSLPVNALRKILQDVVCMDSPLQHDGGALTVAPAAKKGYLQRGHR